MVAHAYRFVISTLLLLVLDADLLGAVSQPAADAIDLIQEQREGGLPPGSSGTAAYCVRVIDAQNRPLADAGVAVQTLSAPYAVVKGLDSNRNGSACVIGVPPGEYTLRIAKGTDRIDARILLKPDVNSLFEAGLLGNPYVVWTSDTHATRGTVNVRASLNDCTVVGGQFECPQSNRSTPLSPGRMAVDYESRSRRQASAVSAPAPRPAPVDSVFDEPLPAGPSRGRGDSVKTALDSVLSTLNTLGSQGAANTIRRGIASGELRDERALEAAIGALLRGADTDPQTRALAQQLRATFAQQQAGAATTIGGPGTRAGTGSRPGAGANEQRTAGRWRCGEASRCNGATEIILPQMGSGGFRLMDSRGYVGAVMDFFWDASAPSRSSSPSAPRYDVVVRMEARSFSLCPVGVGATAYANGQTAGYLGGASSSEIGLEVAPTRSLTRTYTLTGIPEGATVTIRTGDTPRDICLQ
jgi:hypothetical protein